MKPETFSFQSPVLFSSREEAATIINSIEGDGLALGELEMAKLEYIEILLNHPELYNLIDEGILTLGLIKPHANEGRGLPLSDESAAETIINEIGTENIVFSLNLKFSPEDVEAFYGELKDDYSKIINENGLSVWDSIYEFAQSGPLTMLLLYREEGDAVNWWRNKMGKTRPNDADPDSIRGKYAIQENLPNNLTHGSDSIESVKKEIRVFSEIVSNIANSSIENSRNLPSEEKLKTLGVIDRQGNMIGVRRIKDSGMRDESWIYVYEVSYVDAGGDLIKKYVQEKNIISLGGGHSSRAREQEERMDFLASEGIPTPKKYGVVGPAIYTEYLQAETADVVIDSMRRGLIDEDRFNRYLDQLINIARILDKNGFLPTNYFGDLIFSKKDENFLYVDFGSDLGSKGETPTYSSLHLLLKSFSNKEAYILNKYGKAFPG